MVLRFFGRRLARAVMSMLEGWVSGRVKGALGALSSGLSLAMVASSASSAFLVGMFAGFGLQFLRLIDKLSLLGDLAFYATLIGACYAPVAVVSNLIEEERTQRRELERRAKLDGRNAEIKQRNDTKLAAFEEAKKAAWLPWFMTPPDLEPLIGMETVEERLAPTVRLLSPLPLLLLLTVSSYVFLGTYALVFWALAAAIMLPVMALGGWSARLSAMIVCALLFGFLHAEALRSMQPDTRLSLAKGGESERVTMVMTTQSGILALRRDQTLMLYPWRLIDTVGVEPQPNLLVEGARTMLTQVRSWGLASAGEARK
jgi:hypothetical protein